MAEPKTAVEASVTTPQSSDGPGDALAVMEGLQPVLTGSARPACFKSTLQEVLFVLTATMAIAMSSLLAGSVTVISDFAGTDLDMSTAEITWLSSSVSLSAGAFLLFFGRVADMFGRKSLFIGSMFLFSVFALVAGFAKTGISLDILNGVLGLFSASAVPPAQGILGVAYNRPGRRKNAAFACFSAGNPLGFVFGTIFGGIAATLFNWRAAFYLIAIIFFVLSVVGFFIIPPDSTDKTPLTWESLKGFDIVGTFLTVCGIAMFCAALSLGDTAPQGWATPYVLVLLILGVALMVAFVFWERRFAVPLMPMGIWRDRNFSLCLAILVLGMGSFVPAAFFVALYFQEVAGLTSLMVGVHLLPMAISGILVNVFAAFALHRISNKTLMYLATGAYTAAFLLLAVHRYHTSYWALIFPALSLVVVGADLEFNVANMYVMSSMSSSEQSVAGGIFQTLARLATSVGLGIATAVFNAVEEKPSLSSFWDVKVQPYTATFWYSFSAAALSMLLVPFLTIGTQGGRAKSVSEDRDVDHRAGEGRRDVLEKASDQGAAL